MLIRVLTDDVAKPGYHYEHGLSYLIETKDKKILFDTGQSDVFIRNASILGVDLADVDYLVISHGHYDHGGGIGNFLALNKKAKIYIRESAFSMLYSKQENEQLKTIGIAKGNIPKNRLIMTGDRHEINQNAFLFSGVKGRTLFPSRNSSLLKQTDQGLVEDDFDHEQNLLVTENDTTLLVVGCAHNGVINILEHLRTIYGIVPDHVLGGFHLYSSSTNTSEDEQKIHELGERLGKIPAKYHTGHCAGLGPFSMLQEILGDRINYRSAGSEFRI
ncbi:MAG: MBL fold metallo-hydrolase [Bacilli bacterium]|nr:MBL fold metallo-hydrolase [Bacilli bacterium]MBN2696545.1 MBL fold metallo-hydrolase [Bacilli bacterium]